MACAPCARSGRRVLDESDSAGSSVRRSARPHDALLGWVDSLGRCADVACHNDARITPGVVYQLDDRLFFANASYVKGRVNEALRGAPTTTTALFLDAEAMTHVDSAGLQTLGEPAGTWTPTASRCTSRGPRHPISDRLAERVHGASFHGTVRPLVQTVMRDEAEAGATRL